MQELLKRLYADKGTTRAMKIGIIACVFTEIAFFFATLVLLFVFGAYMKVVVSAASAAVGYILVSVVRRLINSPRPYEVYDFYDVPPKDKRGQSMPSRHCYSAFVIATLCYLLHPVCAAVALLVAAVLAVLRVLTGMHFVRDVLVGAAAGVFVGCVGIIICNFI